MNLILFLRVDTLFLSLCLTVTLLSGDSNAPFEQQRGKSSSDLEGAPQILFGGSNDT
jgi:hypothetical protein